MRTAIDEYKRLSDQGMIPLTLGSEGYPPDLETLAEGVDLVGMSFHFLAAVWLVLYLVLSI